MVASLLFFFVFTVYVHFFVFCIPYSNVYVYIYFLKPQMALWSKPWITVSPQLKHHKLTNSIQYVYWVYRPILQQTYIYSISTHSEHGICACTIASPCEVALTFSIAFSRATRRMESDLFSSCPAAAIPSPICRVRCAASRRDQFQTTSGARNDSPLFFDRFHLGCLRSADRHAESRARRTAHGRSDDERKRRPSQVGLTACLAPLYPYTPGVAPAATAASLTAKLSS